MDEQAEPVKAQTAANKENALVVSYRLLSQAIVDRLKRAEANSLITNFMLLVGFHFGFLHILFRMAITFFLNALVYFINDVIDVEIDLSNKEKDHTKALFIKENKRTAVALIICSSALLLISTLLYSKSVCFGVILALLIIFLYTDYFKKMAFFDVIGCFLWGIAMAWPAIPDFSLQGVKLIVLIGLFTASFEVVQSVKDYESDKKSGLTTTPIVIGVPNAFLLARSLYVLSTLYTVFILHEIQGAFLLLPLFMNTKQDMSGYWMKLRVIYGLVWISIMVRLFFGWYQG